MEKDAGKTGAAMLLVVASPFILFLYPTILVLGEPSQVPVILHRYSYGAAAFLLLAALLYATFALALLRRSGALLVMCLIALAVLTFPLPASNVISAGAAIPLLLAATRLLTAIVLAVAAGICVRGRQPGGALAAVVGAALLFVPSAIDTGYLLWQAKGGPAGTTSVTVGYRVPYDLGKLNGHDIVLVGDSFVWGQGVDIRERVGDVLQADLQRRDPAARVYSLGMIGAGLNDYVKALSEVPPAPKIRRVIVSFYQNDMPPRDTLGGWMERLSLALGRSSVSARMVLDIARLSLAPTVDGYIDLVLGDFDQQGAAFPARWRLLVESFDTLYRLAAERSLEQPILAIVPMLTAAEGERWRDAHRRVAAVAAAAGFAVVDLYDDYGTGTAAALRYRVAANDPHFDVAGNQLFAQKLAAAMIGRTREP